jgi:hypothetical protein
MLTAKAGAIQRVLVGASFRGFFCFDMTLSAFGESGRFI